MQAEAEKAKDPVCGMLVSRESPKGGHATHNGTEYAFCNPRCREKFLAGPDSYLTKPASKPATPAAGDTREYTCPMHPEVLRIGPGECPICGMALEPREISLD